MCIRTSLHYKQTINIFPVSLQFLNILNVNKIKEIRLNYIEYTKLFVVFKLYVL